MGQSEWKHDCKRAAPLSRNRHQKQWRQSENQHFSNQSFDDLDVHLNCGDGDNDDDDAMRQAWRSV